MVSHKESVPYLKSIGLENSSASSRLSFPARMLRYLRPAVVALLLVGFGPGRIDAGPTDQVYWVRIPRTLQQFDFGAPGSNPQTATLDIQIPQFDPALGTLTGVDIELWHAARVVYKYESMLDNGHAHIVYLHGAKDKLTVTLPATGRPLVASLGTWPAASPLAPPADGQLDFSDIALTYRMGFDQDPVSGRFTEPEVLDSLRGQGLATLRITANSVFQLDSRSQYFVYTAAMITEGSMQVRYSYDPPARR